MKRYLLCALCMPFLGACFNGSNSSSTTVQGVPTANALSGLAAVGAKMPFSPVKYGIHAIDSKNLTELGETTTDENGEFTISLSEPLPNDAIFYISVLDPVTNEIVVQSVVFPEDTDKHINVTPHSHIIANLVFNSEANDIESAKSDYDDAVEHTLKLLQPIADQANIELSKTTLFHQKFETESGGVDELIESMAVDCDESGSCQLQFKSPKVHGIMTQAHSDAGNAQTLSISNQSGLDDLKSIVSTIETVNTNQAELLKPIGPVLIVFENTGKWGTAADTWAGYNGQLKLINLTDTPMELGDFSIQFASEKLEMSSLWGANGESYPVENDPNKTLYRFKFDQWVLLRPNQNHIVGFNGVGVPENVDDLHACVISDGTEEKKCVFKYGSAAAESYVNSISHGKSSDNSETNSSLIEVVNATNSSTSATKDASVTGKAPPAQSEVSSEAVDVNLSITSGWNTGFNGMLQFDSPITSNGWTIEFQKPSEVQTLSLWSNEGGLNNDRIEISNPNWDGGDKLHQGKTTKVEFGVTGSGSYGTAQSDDCELRTAGMIYPCTLNIEQSETAMPDMIESREQLTTEAQPLELFTLPITQQPPPSEPTERELTAISSAVIRGSGTTQSKTPQKLEYASPSNFDSKIVAGYLSEWSVYGREFDVERLNQNGNFPYNKLVVAFLGICGDNGKLKGTIDEQCRKQNLTEGEAVFLDPWALFGTRNNDRQKAIKWIDGEEAGLMEQLAHLKKQHGNNLQIAASIGGWTMSEPFHRIAATETGREKFVQSLQKIQTRIRNKYELNYGFSGFDGFDIDWEFPGHGGESKKFTPNDGEYFKELVCDVKTEMPNITVSSAVGATFDFIDKIGENYREIASRGCLDYIYMMNYDFFGGWDSKIGHQTNLLPAQGFVGEVPSAGEDRRWSIDASIRAFEKYGFPKSKLLIGVANYARGIKSADFRVDSQSGAVSGTKTNPADPVGTYEKGVMEGYDLWRNIADKRDDSGKLIDMKGRGDFKLMTDFEAHADAYYNPTTHDYFSIDTPRTAYLKAKIAHHLGLAGSFVWTVEQDDGRIVTAMQDGFGLNDSTLDDRKSLYTICGIPLENRSHTNSDGTTEEVNYCEKLFDGISVDTAQLNDASSVKAVLNSALGKYALISSGMPLSQGSSQPVINPITPPTGTTNPSPPSDNSSAFVITTDVMDDDESAISEPFMTQIETAKTMLATIDTDEALLVTPNRSENPDNVKRIEAILDPKLTPETTDDPELWEFLFPRRNGAYTYEGFLQSAAKFPAFCGSDEMTCRKSLATMFAHFAQETGENSEFVETTNNIPKWRQALYFVRESGWLEGSKDGYNADCTAFPGNWKASAYPCGRISNEESPENEGEYKSYFGRGAKQLSYNFNYGPLSRAIYGDVETLLNDPAQVADSWLNFASAIYFYILPQPPKPSMLSVIDGSWVPNEDDESRNLSAGFGATINIINGGLECTVPEGGTEDQRAENRIGYYEKFAEALGYTIDAVTDETSCVGMKRFSSQGGGALPIYWDTDWGWDGERGGPSYRCKLVEYQTPYSALTETGYRDCVTDMFLE